jgi:hypothetical protein
MKRRGWRFNRLVKQFGTFLNSVRNLSEKMRRPVRKLDELLKFSREYLDKSAAWQSTEYFPRRGDPIGG